MKLKLSIASAIIFGLALTGCSKNDTDLLTRIKSKGKIVIATEGEWAPWTYYDENDNLTGFDVELGKKIAEKLGVKADFAVVEWDGILAGIDANRYDIACNGIGITEERQLKYDFSIPYAYTHTVLVTRKDNDLIKNFEDLNGRTTANSVGSTYEEVAKSYGATVLTIDSFDQTLELLNQGRIDATLNDNASFYYYEKQKPDNNFKVANTDTHGSQVAIPIRKTDKSASLKDAIDKAIEELNQSGELKELSLKFFGTDLTK